MRLFSVAEEFRRRFIVLKINIVGKIKSQELRERECLASFFYREGRVAENTLSGVRFRGLRYSKLSEIC